MDAPRQIGPFPWEFPLPSTRIPTCLLLCLLALLFSACGRNDNPLSPGPLDGDGGTDPDPGFREVLVDPANLAKPWGKALGDLDGDGGPDALAGLFGGGVYWYRHPGWEKSRLGDRFGGDDLLAADMDGDGALDAVTNGGSIAWYRNPKGTGVDPASPWELHMVHAGLQGHDLAVADLDRDGRADIASRQDRGPTTLFLQGEGRSWRRLDLGQAGSGTGMAVADVNGDRRIDVVGNGYWLEQPASLEGDWPRHDFTDWHATSAVAVADLNGDGRQDIVLSVGADLGHIAWFEAPADAANGDWTGHRVGQADYVHRIHLADLDLDGDADIVFAEQDGGRESRVGWFSNRQGGKAWDLMVISESGAHNIALGDVGQDGDLDILGADWRGDTRLKLWENQNRNPATAEPENAKVPEAEPNSGSGA